MSKLKAKKPTSIEKRLKVLFYGGPGAGKTTAAISFPKVYLIDTERGAENDSYTKLLEKGGGVILQTSDFEEVIDQIKALLTEKHEYKTLIIDPLTTLYNDLLDKSALLLKNQSKDKDATGTEFGRHYGEANKKMKHLLSLLLRLDMNVIITAHQKHEYSGNMTVIGSTFDCYKKLDYLFDLVFEIQKRGDKRVALIKKTRIESFPDGGFFDFSYEEVSKRYGKHIIEKDATQEILATTEEINELKRLKELFNVSEETFDKWLEKCNASSPEELSQEAIQKIIAYLQSQVNKGEKKDA